MTENIREHVLRLMKQKETIEDEIKQLTQILTLNGVGMDDPLVDANDFPIGSIDLYQVRHARHRIIRLQNDHKAVMQQIESGLEGYYSNPATRATNGVHRDIEMEPENRVVHETPFIKVTLVSPGSPAESAGLSPNDEIMEFGSINATNFKNLADIGLLVQHSEGSAVLIRLKRNGRSVTTQLTPQRWQGRGLLGCNIDILK